ncbi:MAG: hypothetical protein CM1200mP34_2330 [Verrucomicrobiales bacterium]|nr:MAG: hypothetical protein CM1200mP34_2330 [Verrucomicrobiales bacterium]
MIRTPPHVFVAVRWIGHDEVEPGPVAAQLTKPPKGSPVMNRAWPSGTPIELAFARMTRAC